MRLRPSPAPAGTRALVGPLLRAAVRGMAPITAAHLMVLAGPQAGQRFAIGSSQTLGRGRRATIRLHDGQASRLHARIQATGESVQVEDLGSKNGVRLNGKPLRHRSTALRPGDEIAIGSTRLALVGSAEEARAGTEVDGPPASGSAHTPGSATHSPRRIVPATLALAGAAALLAAAIGLGVAAARHGPALAL